MTDRGILLVNRFTCWCGPGMRFSLLLLSVIAICHLLVECRCIGVCEQGEGVNVAYGVVKWF